MTNAVTVQTVQRISTSEDGSLIEMHVKGDLDERVILKFTPEVAGTVLATRDLAPHRFS